MGWLIARNVTAMQARLRLVWLSAAAYLGLMGVATWQALRGESLVAPSALTLLVAAIAVAGTALLAVLALRAKGPEAATA